MIFVLDASALLGVILRTGRGAALGKRLLEGSSILCAPHLLDLEIAQVLRRYFLAGDLSEDRAREALRDFSDMPIERYPHAMLLSRVWELRQNHTAYDAAYVALAEAIDATLITADQRLASSVGHRAKIEIV